MTRPSLLALLGAVLAVTTPADALIVRGGGSVANDCLRVPYLGPGLGSRAIADPRAYLVHSTWFDTDFFAAGALDESGFDRLATAVARLGACYEVDESRFVSGGGGSEASSRRACTFR
jgi:hypothetical protein